MPLLSDLDRTFINHPAFHLSPMLLRLRRVLVAFATHHPHIGYCQSLNFLAGYLLLFFVEEDAFWLMTAVVNSLLPSDYFTDSMLGLHTDLNVLALLISTHLPRLHAHLTSLNVDIRPISFPWFLSVFVKTLPIESTLRVWDSFVVEGSKVLFRTALAILSINEQRICRLTNFGQLYSLISVMGAVEFDCERLMEEGFAMRGISRKTIERLRRKERKRMERDLQETKRKQSERAAQVAAAAAAAGGKGMEVSEGAEARVRVPVSSDEEEVHWTEDEEDEMENSFKRRSRSGLGKEEEQGGSSSSSRHQQPTAQTLPTAEPVVSVAQTSL